MRATKAQLLAGGREEPFTVPALDGAEVVLRPLSAPEAEEVQAAQVAGISLSGLRADDVGPRPVGKAAPRGEGKPRPAMELDFGKVLAGAYEAQILATFYGLVDPAMTLDEVRQLRPPQIVEQIGEEVMKRSGLGDDVQQQLESFRSLAGGPGDARPPSERGASGPDSGPAHAPPAGIPTGGAESAGESG